MFACEPQDGRWLLVTLVIGVSLTLLHHPVTSIKPSYYLGLNFFREKL